MTIFIGTSAAGGNQDFLDNLEKRMGVTANIFRQYFNDFGQDGPNITTRGDDDANKGRISWISFKPPSPSQLGVTTLDAVLKAMTDVLNTGTSSALSAAKVQVVKDGFIKIRNGMLNSKQRRWIITPFHEPEDNKPTPALFVKWLEACYDHLKPFLNDAGHETIIAHLLMAWTFNHPEAGRSPELYWSDKVDGVLLDSYGNNANHNPSAALDKAFAFCRAKKKALGKDLKVWVGETGDSDNPATPNVDEQVKWVKDLWNYFKTNSDVAGGFCYWEGGQRMSTDTEQAFAQIIKEAAVFEVTTKDSGTDTTVSQLQAELDATKAKLDAANGQVSTLTTQLSTANSARSAAESRATALAQIIADFKLAHATLMSS